MSDNVLNAPVNAKRREENTAKQGKTNFFRQLIPVAVSVCLLLVAVVGTVLLSGKSAVTNVFAVQINPSACFVTDGRSTVKKVVSLNADADVVLADLNEGKDLIGKKLSVSVTKYTDSAAKLGYIDLKKDGSAVRISTTCTGGLLDTATDGLKEYFRASGYYGVAIGESVSENEWKTRTGFSEKEITEQSAMFRERDLDGIETEELKDRYGKNFIDGMRVTVGSILKANIDRIERNASDIEELYRLNDIVEKHENNPNILFKDYWSVKSNINGSFSDSFAETLGNMEAALNKYESDYGVKITNSYELTMAKNSYAALPMPTLKLIVDNTTSELFGKYVELFAEILDVSGIADGLAEIASLPETVEQYMQKAAAVKSEFDRRLDLFERIYLQTREPISETDYETFTNKIISDYGSLENYWEEWKKL